MGKNTDIFTLEVIKDSLQALGEEMFTTVARTSMSPVIYETLDYASGLTDKDGNLLTQGDGITGFIGMLSSMVKETLNKFGDQLFPGDLIIINDPYQGGGSHLSDVGLVLPIFYQGEIVAFSANKAHWTEVGGMDPGSFTNRSTEIYQEGLQFSCIKLFNRGEINEGILDIIRSNVRYPDQSLGDMWAQVAGLRVGESRFIELCDKYGIATIQETIDFLLDHGEQLALLAINELPQGSYEASEYIDGDGLGNEHFLINVKITIENDRMIFDFRGSHEQVPGPINLSYSGLVAGVRAMFLSITVPGEDVNDGIFRPIEILVDPASILACEKPAPVSNYFITLLEAINVIQKALAPVIPAKLTAGHYAAVCSVVMGGLNPATQSQFLLVEPTTGGWGASNSNDGQSGQFCYGNGETYNVPAEVAEARYGLLMDEYSLRIEDSGAGAGEFRGGHGTVRKYKALSDNQYASVTFGHHKSLPWGVDGGLDGSNNEYWIERADGSKEGPFGMGQHILNTNDSLILLTGTGGGYGSPKDRPREQVKSDLKNQYYSLKIAHEIYEFEEK
ncbi:hydantoinase B/oxoprolinase family protein [Hutsoniella sourekii]|uniref:hydantoinase B/oxoprolinase family protein n=1 Tax=Hutsoniella sourekii TaxID=87650 RepID=UPI0004B988F7|nr:hydantoinase B/oxoprolinase family protein [Hutsoniella sourekii]